MLFLLSNKGFKGGDYNVVVSKNQCFPLVGAVEPHPGQGIWHQMPWEVSKFSHLIDVGAHLFNWVFQTSRTIPSSVKIGSRVQMFTYESRELPAM